MLFANQEEKSLVSEAIASFDVDVTDQADLSQWDYEGGALTPCRKVNFNNAGYFVDYLQYVLA